MSTSVTFASFLAAVSTFFVGALISRLGDTDYIIRVPVAYLIISMLGFLFAAVFYMNGVNLIKYQRERAKYCNNFATTIMEYF
ncbi:MAG TPA: hypothetical protein PK765_02490 [bacterium]|nr:hypothetical protein [bacterium]